MWPPLTRDDLKAWRIGTPSTETNGHAGDTCRFEISYDDRKGKDRAVDVVAIDGVEKSPATVMEELNKIAGANGIGRVDIVENRYVGMKARGCYETPAGTVLLKAHRAIESITLDREVTFLRDSLIPSYARMIYNGFWFSPERKLIQQTVDQSQIHVTGEVRLKLYKGNCTVMGRKAEKSLYNQNIASFEDNHGYSQNDADGFIKLNALRLKLYAETFGD